MAVAVTMTGVAWRVLRNERVRSEARIATLAADIHRRDADEVPFAAEVTPAASAAAAGMFKDRDAARPTGAAIGAGMAAIGAMVILVLLVTGGSRGTSAARTSGSVPRTDLVPTRGAAVTTKPLELIALGHERDADRLIVRGVVRNPSSGGIIDHLTAVVSLFGRDGELIGTERAAVDAVTLAPGGETTFALTLPRAGDVSRYRVSFRTGQGVLPHVDRRS